MYRSTYQGGPYVELFHAKAGLGKTWAPSRANAVHRPYDTSLASYVITLSGPSTVGLFHPPERDGRGLGLTQPYLALQLLATSSTAGLEVVALDAARAKRRIYFSPSFRELRATSLHSQVPLQIPTDTWLTLVVDVGGIVASLYGQGFASIEQICLRPEITLRSVFTLQSPPTPSLAAAPGLPLPANHVSAQLPGKLSLPPTLASEIVLVDDAVLSHYRAGAPGPRGTSRPSSQRVPSAGGAGAGVGSARQIGRPTPLPVPAQTSAPLTSARAPTRLRAPALAPLRTTPLSTPAPGPAPAPAPAPAYVQPSYVAPPMSAPLAPMAPPPAPAPAPTVTISEAVAARARAILARAAPAPAPLLSPEAAMSHAHLEAVERDLGTTLERLTQSADVRVVGSATLRREEEEAEREVAETLEAVEGLYVANDGESDGEPEPESEPERDFTFDQGSEPVDVFACTSRNPLAGISQPLPPPLPTQLATELPTLQEPEIPTFNPEISLVDLGADDEVFSSAGDDLPYDDRATAAAAALACADSEGIGPWAAALQPASYDNCAPSGPELPPLLTASCRLSGPVEIAGHRDLDE